MSKKTKLFEVIIDNNPGGWKSGDDPHLLVLADSGEDAINKVRNGWSSKYLPGYRDIMYGKNLADNYVTDDTNLSAKEILFDGVDLILTTERKEKLKRINK